MRAPPAEPPFDPRWLDALAGLCAEPVAARPRLEDVYLERRLELRVVANEGGCRTEECRTEGSAVRWSFPRRRVLTAAAGTSTVVLSELFGRFGRQVALPPVRPLSLPELDPPRGWREWAAETLARVTRGHATLRFLARMAAVVSSAGWRVVESPSLASLQLDGGSGPRLLAVWDHPRLGAWLTELASPPPAKRWQPPSGLRAPVVFTEGSGGVLLHELVGHLTESDLVSSGLSPLARLAGAAIAPATLTIRDDPTRSDLPGGYSCDDEGTVAGPLPLVESGTLVGWLCDRDGARLLGGPAGRGRRAGWSAAPAPRVSNLVVSPGTTKPSDLEAGVAEGLVVTRVAGATVDPASGRMVVQAEAGWELRHGRRRRPLAPFDLVGTALPTLAHLDPALGDDPCPDWRLGWCVKGGLPLPTGTECPSLLLHRLEVL